MPRSLTHLSWARWWSRRSWNYSPHSRWRPKNLSRDYRVRVFSSMSYITQWNTAGLLGRLEERDVEAASQGLDRLTQAEARTTALEVLETVHGLVQDMNAITDGKKMHSACHPSVFIILSRQQAICRWCLGRSRYVSFATPGYFHS